MENLLRSVVRSYLHFHRVDGYADFPRLVHKVTPELVVSILWWKDQSQLKDLDSV